MTTKKHTSHYILILERSGEAEDGKRWAGEDNSNHMYFVEGHTKNSGFITLDVITFGVTFNG